MQTIRTQRINPYLSIIDNQFKTHQKSSTKTICLFNESTILFDNFK